MKRDLQTCVNVNRKYDNLACHACKVKTEY